MRSPIFILGSHKSGTSLIRSLFDGHPELFVLPFETHFLQHAKYHWIDYRIRRTFPGQPSKDGFVKAAKEWIRENNREVNREADSVTAGLLSEPVFDEAIACIREGSAPRQWYEQYFDAIHQALYREELPEERRVVEKSVEHAEFAEDISSEWPDATFVHVVRNPYATLLSIRRFQSADGFPWLGAAYQSLYNSWYHLHRNRRHRENYLVVRYEDLVAEPRSTMERVCRHVDVPFREGMLQPTSLGRFWPGNSTTGQDFEGISSERLGEWKQSISGLEVELINRYLSHTLHDFNYEFYHPKRSPYWPIWGEAPHVYVANRVLLATG